jgi:Family of unknown function (DUF6146)
VKMAIYILFILLALCQSEAFGQKKGGAHNTAVDTLSADSVEYELTIIDPGFDTWLLTKPNKEYLSKNYYEYMNRLYVAEWNYRYLSNKSHGEYDSYVEYDPNTDYGLDINYRLYYYFKYFEEQHNTKLYPGFR